MLLLQYNPVPKSIYKGLNQALKWRNKITEKGGISEAEDGNEK